MAEGGDAKADAERRELWTRALGGADRTVDRVLDRDTRKLQRHERKTRSGGGRK